MSPKRILCLTLLWTCLSAVPLMGQTQEAPAAPGQIKLNFPENLELKVLVDYVGQRLGINFIYDENIGSKRVTIKAPQEIPADSLLALTESALRMKGLMLSRTEVPKTMRIEAARQLTALSSGPQTQPAAGDSSVSAVTRVFQLKYAKPQRVEQVVTPFLSVPTASQTSLVEQNLIIITDYADNMKRIEDLVALVDRPGAEVTVQFVAVLQQDAAVMTSQVTQLLNGKAKARDAAGAAAVSVIADERTNRLAVVGGVDEVREAVGIIQQLDMPLGLETKVYSFATASAEEVDRLTKLMIGDVAAKRFYKAAADHDSNLLIVTTTAEIHKQVALLTQTLDKPVSETQAPIRFYKLENAKAADVLETLRGIQGEGLLRDIVVDGLSSGAPASEVSSEPRVFQGPSEAQVNGTDPTTSRMAAIPGLPAGPATRGKPVQAGELRIMADEPSNSIIVVAKPAMQAVYERLIKKLDVRRPQVLIEATLVTLDTTNEFKLGVEFSKEISLNGGRGKALTFSNFGLSTTDPDTGAITLKPGVGFNGALITTDIANIILQALKNDSRIHVQAQPTILVNDNATGNLVSQQEEPFVTVNASSQVALNTFGGYSSAGTNISIKPQISEGENLKLDYEITLSSFTGAGSNGLPPARQSNMLKSEVTIPNGYTIVLGGLSRETRDDNVDRLPILGEIPVLEYAFSNRRNTVRRSTLFVFIRAVVLRADKFEDLKALSNDSIHAAGLPGDFPASEPVGIR